MKILHYITDLTANAGPIAGQTKMMMACTAKATETTLMTSTPLPEELTAALKERYGIRTHLIKRVDGRNPMQWMVVKKKIAEVLKEVKPQIVHVHGAWCMTAAMVEKVARKANIATIVSPHKALSQEIIQIDFWKTKLPRLLAYQIWMVRKSTAIVALNQKEKENILQLGLKKRIEVMPAIPKDLDSAGLLRDALMAAYRKALDSTYHKHLTKTEIVFVERMVRATLADGDAELLLPDTHGVSMRNIFFYAHDEDVTDMMMLGAQKMAIPLPQTLNVSEVPRYRNTRAKQRGSLNDITLQKEIRIPTEKQLECIAVQQIAKAHIIGIKRLTLRHWTELYKLFRYTDFNEDVVGRELERLKLKKHTIMIQQRLNELFSLKQGYNIF